EVATHAATPRKARAATPPASQGPRRRRRAGASGTRSWPEVSRIRLRGMSMDARGSVWRSCPVRRKRRANRQCLNPEWLWRVSGCPPGHSRRPRGQLSPVSPLDCRTLGERHPRPMCGIVGAIADRDVVPVLIEGLKRLEYRGYASAGIAVVEGSEVRRVRRTGRVSEMEGAAGAEGFSATLGIGHTRWATHGGVTESNAHPHVSHGVALVHNGIIENHEEQRERLRGLGYAFESQTDTEVIAHLIHHYLAGGDDLLGALQRAVKELHGAYALAVVSRKEPGRMVVARMGCPLLVGLGEGENFV